MDDGRGRFNYQNQNSNRKKLEPQRYGGAKEEHCLNSLAIYPLGSVRLKEKCYLCGSSDKLTKDHVPPKCLFPPPLPTALITVRCCEKCNNAFSLDDEAIMIWITSVAGLNDKGQWVLRNRVAPILRAKTKLRGHVKKHVKIETVNTPNGPMTVPLSYFPDERGDRFMIRLAKGFITHCHPEYDYSRDKFTVQVAKPWNLAERTLWKSIIDKLAQTHFGRGDGVLDVWHAHPCGDDMGAWMFCFYRAAFIVVWQESGIPI